MRVKQQVLCLLLLMLLSVAGQSQNSRAIEAWYTNADRSALFKKTSLKFQQQARGSIIFIDSSIKYQEVEGLGFSLTGGSAQHLIKMKPAARNKILKELFSTDNGGIGISYIRLSIGASDLNETIFSYNDLPAGETDTAMLNFDLSLDKQDVIPVMKEILTIAPQIRIMASPWSPPTWMKTNNDTRGGRLKPEYFAAYSTYFIKYIRAMEAVGIPIHAITIQNEPLHPGNNPSLLMPAPDQADFIKNHLGPDFAKEGIKTGIITYDHNADRPDYPLFILNDPEAKKYIIGSGFHLYGGRTDAMSYVHDAHPDKGIYFTEQMVVDFRRGGGIEDKRMHIARPLARVMIGSLRNWSRNVILWNLAADTAFKPYTDRGGCPVCQGAITIDGDKITRNLAYYVMAHASALIRPGSVRIKTNEPDDLSNAAFITKTGDIVVLVANTGSASKEFTIDYYGKKIISTVQAGSAVTLSWKK